MQPFPYYVVLDFEATCDEQDPPRPQEIIEFPSVLMRADTMTVVDAFESFVRPVHHPLLTPFCTELTSIEQEDVAAADPFEVVYARHRSWLRSHDLDVDGEGHPFAFITCGDWDLRTMFPVQRAVLPVPFDFVERPWRQWINIKHTYRALLGERPRGMVSMLSDLGLTLEGRHHRGIDDCRNIARIVAALAERGASLDITATLSPRSYPPLDVLLMRDGVERPARLPRRSVASALGVASATFRRQALELTDEEGQVLDASQLADLRPGARLIVR